MRTFFFRLALGAGLVFTSPGVANEGPKEPPCHTSIENFALGPIGMPPALPIAGVAAVPEPVQFNASTLGESQGISRLRQWLVTGAATCTILAGGYVGCRMLTDNHDVQTAFKGAAVAVGMQQLLALLRMMVAPQADAVGKWTVRTFYAMNHSLMQWFFGKDSRLDVLGDRHSPNLAVDIMGRQSEFQQLTSAEIGSVVTHLDWLGLRLPELLKNGQVESAAHQLVTTVVHLSYDTQEIIVRTTEPHVDEMTRSLVMLAAESYLFKKLAECFESDRTLLARFNVAVQAALYEQKIAHPMPFFAYRKGIEIVLNGWMADYVRDNCDGEFCVNLD